MQPFEELEKKYSSFLNVKGSVSCNTGTSALHLALEGLQLPPDSQVIVPEFTMVATAWAVYYARLTPIFVDCGNDMLINLDLLEQSITNKTKVLIITHVYGRLVNMTRVMEIAKRYNLRVIEDACEAQGAFWEDKPIGSFDIGCVSFYRNKIIHAEEGGMVSSNDLDFLDIVRDMKSMSFGKKHNYSHSQIGFNYRMTNSQASLVLNSLKNVNENLSHRKVLESTYNKHLHKSLLLPNRESVWIYDIKVSPNIKNNLVEYLNSKGIAARHSFKPMSSQHPFNLPYKHLKSFELSNSICYLPVSENMSIEDAIHIADITNKFLNL